MSLTKIFSRELQTIEEYILSYFKKKKSYAHPGFKNLLASIQYSLESPGKRFRPLLSVLTGEALGAPIDRVLPIAASVEFIHTYSLIHDDLPCMDNDDVRRGRPTNHKKFGEAMALLAGDALLTEAFLVVAESDKIPDLEKSKCLALVAEFAGASGMVGGQAMDIEPPQGGHSEEQIKWVHDLKTGALIKASVLGAAMASGATNQQLADLKTYSERLGFAFQLADDIDDYNPDEPEATSYTQVMGLEKTKSKLVEVSDQAREALFACGVKDGGLLRMVEFNQERVGFESKS